MASLKRFETSWSQFKDQYDERFYRMWKYYLSSCAGSFRARKNQLWQIVMVKETFKGDYKAIRNLQRKPTA
ncbi:class I SAM-dependent methyltransferase [Echinicola sp. 20G]|uniref:class I SAM-dependent methyltransferase n=1 Tax=Echinicola sp. 20G TaxID=2781961 RepID=UPI0019111CAD